MRLMVGLDPQGKVVEIVLVSHKESRGLGTRVADPVFLSQFRGRGGPLVLKKDDPLGNIDGIAKATMSTRGVIMAVEEAQRIFREVWERPE
jgi:electron transport complex protein RnfG